MSRVSAGKSDERRGLVFIIVIVPASRVRRTSVHGCSGEVEEVVEVVEEERIRVALACPHVAS